LADFGAKDLTDYVKQRIAISAELPTNPQVNRQRPSII